MLMQIDGTFLFSMISFLIFLLIIKFIVLRPIKKVLDNRDNYFFKNSKMEQDSKQKSKALLDQQKTLLNETRNEASEILKKASNESKQQHDLEINESKKTAKDEIIKNQQELENQNIQAKNQIKPQMENIVKSIVSKVLCEDIDIHLDENEINKYLKL